jgi:adenine-specific DNA-methyltransferase
MTADHLVLTKRRVQSLTPEGEWSGIPENRVQYARRLRKESSPPEQLLWARLRHRQLGAKFRRQHQLGPYIADFYCREAGLVVEVDGETHFTAQAIAHDCTRDAWMEQLSLTVRRFSASEIASNLDGVVEEIWNESRQRVLDDEPTKQWVQARRLKAGNIVFAGETQQACSIESTEFIAANEPVHDLEIEDAHSFVTETCAIHNCGSPAVTTEFSSPAS